MDLTRTAAFIGAACLACPALAQPVDLNFGVIASVQDSNLDGTPDLVTPNGTLVRARSSRDEDRAILEFDISQFAGKTVVSARFVGRVNVNNSFDTGVRSFNFNIYAGNGSAELQDYNENTNTVGTGNYHPPMDFFFDFDFDVAAQLQTLIDGGSGWVGFNIDAIEVQNFPNVLSNDQAVTKLVVEVQDTADCLADTNNDGSVTPADFTAWIAAFNAMAPECDQNNDGSCTPADFTAWIANFNAGC